MPTKIESLRELEKLGVVVESCPDPDFWRFRVIKPLELPERFHREYLSSGEIRWYGFEEV